jgi:hypothetical protein
MPAYAVVRAYGGSGITARLEPATIEGLVYASSMVILYAARHRVPAPSLDSGQHNPRLACSPVLRTPARRQSPVGKAVVASAGSAFQHP